MLLSASRMKPTRGLFIVLGVFLITFVLFRRVPRRDVATFPLAQSADETQTSKFKIGKASMLYGDYNELFEKALQTHATHNEVHGYPMHVLRSELTSSYWNKLLHIQSIIVAELAKPKEERLDWIWWADPSIILLNPSIPLDAFLPPEEPNFIGISFLATRISGELDTSTFFIKVSQWSLLLLTKTMALPLYDSKSKLNTLPEAEALSTVLKEPGFRELVMYQPMQWYNSPIAADLHFSNTGDLLLAFPDSLGENRWKAMSDVLDVITPEGNKAKLPFPLEYTHYPGDIGHYWGAIVEGRSKLHDAEWAISKLGEAKAPPALKDAVAKMKEVIVTEMDNETRMREAVERIKWHLNLVKVPK